MCPVSTKCQRMFGRCRTTAAPFPANSIVACFSLNRSDWRRVLTTSNGLVTMAPHIPPTLCTLMSTSTTSAMRRGLTRQQRSAARTLREASWNLTGLPQVERACLPFCELVRRWAGGGGREGWRQEPTRQGRKAIGGDRARPSLGVRHQSSTCKMESGRFSSRKLTQKDSEPLPGD